MKKILITLLIAVFATGLQAQIIQGKSANPQIIQGKSANPYSDKQEIKLIWSNHTGWNYFEKGKEFLVEILIEMNTEKGNMIKFKASAPVEKVVVAASETWKFLADPQPGAVESTTNYSAGTTTGIFYLDAPSYAGHKFYTLKFYAPGLQMPVWMATVEREIILKIPKTKQIPKD
jgi:hypothetical protein